MLRPGGLIRIAVPDFGYFAQQYRQGHAPASLVTNLMGGHCDEFDYHKSLFNERGLRDLMRRVGLVQLHKWSSANTDCAALPCSLNIGGYKPAPVEKIGDTIAVMSMPRLAFTANMFCVTGALMRLGIPVANCSGAFWEMALTQIIEKVLRSNPQYILTVDYDSVFTDRDVAGLYRLISADKTMDAICPLQPRREDGQLMVGNEDADQQERVGEWEHETRDVHWGHFGLTLIRASAFDRIEKPWFWSQPDQNRQWNDGRCMADIWFWRRFREAGCKLCMAQQIGIGHLEQMVAWTGRDLRPLHQSITDWNARGKPLEAR